jgi:hypothetical protein
VNEGGGHTELVHVFKHDTMVVGVEGPLQVHIPDVDVFAAYFVVFHHHHHDPR